MKIASLALLAGAVLVLAPDGSRWHRFAAAQQSEPITLEVPPVTNAAPASRVRLSIQVRQRDGLAKNAFIRIRGLPAAAALSEGYAIAPGAWAVPLNALPNLLVLVPVGLEGKSEVIITLVNVEGSILAEATTTLTVARATPTAPPAQAAAPPNSTSRALSAPQLAAAGSSSVPPRLAWRKAPWPWPPPLTPWSWRASGSWASSRSRAKPGNGMKGPTSWERPRPKPACAGWGLGELPLACRLFAASTGVFKTH